MWRYFWTKHSCSNWSCWVQRLKTETKFLAVRQRWWFGEFNPAGAWQCVLVNNGQLCWCASSLVSNSCTSNKQQNIHFVMVFSINGLYLAFQLLVLLTEKKSYRQTKLTLLSGRCEFKFHQVLSAFICFCLSKRISFYFCGVYVRVRNWE